jgi:hypothetical protein
MGKETIAPIWKQEEKKKFVRRLDHDDSQRIRRVVQWLFVALNGWLGIQFLLWVRYCERGEVSDKGIGSGPPPLLSFCPASGRSADDSHDL